MTDEAPETRDQAGIGDTSGIVPGMPRHLYPVARGQERPDADEAARLDALEAADDRGAFGDIAARQRAFRTHAWERACPAKYADARLAILRPQQDPDGLVTGWLAYTASPTLILVGPSDRGKSYAAFAVGRAAFDAGQWVTAWPFPDLINSLRPSDIDPGLRDRTLVAVTRADIVILDDLGKESRSPWTIEQTWSVLNARGNDRLRTIVTINKTDDTVRDLDEWYGSPIVNRLLAGATIARIEGDALSARPRF